MSENTTKKLHLPSSHKNHSTNPADRFTAHQGQPAEPAEFRVKQKPETYDSRLYANEMNFEVSYDTKDSQTFNSETKFTQTPKEKPIKYMTPSATTKISDPNREMKKDREIQTDTTFITPFQEHPISLISPRKLYLPRDNNPLTMETRTPPPITSSQRPIPTNHISYFNLEIISTREDQRTTQYCPIETENADTSKDTTPFQHETQTALLIEANALYPENVPTMMFQERPTTANDQHATTPRKNPSSNITKPYQNHRIERTDERRKGNRRKRKKK